MFRKAGNRVANPIGADCSRVIIPDLQSQLQPGSDDNGLDAKIFQGHGLKNVRKVGNNR